MIITQEQLKCEIKECDMILLARHFNSVEIYLEVFGLTAAEKADVRRFVDSYGTQVAICKCLQFWKKQDPSKATIETLLEVLLQLREEEVALKLIKHYYFSNE